MIATLFPSSSLILKIVIRAWNVMLQSCLQSFRMAYVFFVTYKTEKNPQGALAENDAVQVFIILFIFDKKFII